MSTIETEMIDRYILGVMKNQEIPVRERAHSAAAAIAVHVMTEMGLPMNVPLQVQKEDVDFLLSAHQDKFADHRDDLADQVDDAYEALGLEVSATLAATAMSMSLYAVKDTQPEVRDEEAAIITVIESTMLHDSMLDPAITEALEQGL